MNNAELSTEPRQRPHIRNVLPLFAAHVRRIPFWQKLVLGVALVAGIAGIFAGLFHAATPAATGGSHVSRVQVPHSGMMDSPDVNAGNDPSSTAAADSSLAAPWYSRVGISLVVGFIFGWLLRTFLRLVAIVALIVGAALGALSHYHIIGSDLATEGREKYHEATSWVASETSEVKDAVLAHVPSSAGAFVGVFMGMRKRH